MLKNKNILYYLLISFILNLIPSLFLDLSHDEAYYFIYSKELSFGYYDHPPMVALLIRMGTFLFGQNEFGVRIFFNLLEVLTLFILFKMGGKNNEKNIFLLSLCFPLLIGAGFLALPDTSILFFSTCYFYYLKKYLDRVDLKTIVSLALAIALMLYSKYHAGLVIILTILAHPRILLKKSFYAVAIISLILFLPHLYYQYMHDFITFKFHLFKRGEKHFDIKNILGYLSTQILLLGGFMGPIILLRAFYKKVISVYEKILKFQIFGFLIFLFVLSFRNKVEANWTITIIPPLILLTASGYESLKFKNLLYLSIFLFSAFKLVTLFPPEIMPIKRLHEVHHWKYISNKIKKNCEGNKIVANEYQLASKLSFYLETDVRAIHLSGRESQFSLMDNALSENENVCYVRFSKKNLLGYNFIKESYPGDVYQKTFKYKDLLEIEK